LKKYSIPAVVFAGGKSSRMGKDKSLLPFGGFPTLIEFQFSKLKKIFNKVYISWKSEKVDLGKDVSIFDIEPNIFAPTIGLLSIFDKLESEYIFIFSVDAPFFGEREIGKVMDTFQNHIGEYEIYIPQHREGLEPMIGIYSRKLYPKIAHMVQDGNHKLKSLISNSKVLKIDFDEVEPFTNLNYWNEYQKARDRI